MPLNSAMRSSAVGSRAAIRARARAAYDLPEPGTPPMRKLRANNFVFTGLPRWSVPNGCSSNTDVRAVLEVNAHAGWAIFDAGW